ncbi:MAG: hypothetical protein ACP5H2_06820 [Solirubrobacteraceae bacterium]
MFGHVVPVATGVATTGGYFKFSQKKGLMMTSSHSEAFVKSGRRLAAAAAVSAAALAFPMAAMAASFKLTPHIRNHTPIINRKWPLEIDVTKGRDKLSGTVKYQFLFSGSVVSTQKGHRFKNGVYKDTMKFPPDSLGEPLTLRILVTTRYGTEHVDWKVTSKK